ncbi:unnamed protein product [Dovyalis caffra]|uniref:Uncharacterized protein n=1 Tax=Dovyalis caffra TaxID=77055 RepID=A0AAV1SMT6_9ROSI|nr:unnamed protein product [Dovyalis caffra]
MAVNFREFSFTHTDRDAKRLLTPESVPTKANEAKSFIAITISGQKAFEHKYQNDNFSPNVRIRIGEMIFSYRDGYQGIS